MVHESVLSHGGEAAPRLTIALELAENLNNYLNI
jgi:hypothetical protein